MQLGLFPVWSLGASVSNEVPTDVCECAAQQTEHEGGPQCKPAVQADAKNEGETVDRNQCEKACVESSISLHFQVGNISLSDCY